MGLGSRQAGHRAPNLATRQQIRQSAHGFQAGLPNFRHADKQDTHSISHPWPLRRRCKRKALAQASQDFGFQCALGFFRTACANKERGSELLPKPESVFVPLGSPPSDWSRSRRSLAGISALATDTNTKLRPTHGSSFVSMHHPSWTKKQALPRIKRA